MEDVNDENWDKNPKFLADFRLANSLEEIRDRENRGRLDTYVGSIAVGREVRRMIRDAVNAKLDQAIDTAATFLFDGPNAKNHSTADAAMAALHALEVEEEVAVRDTSKQALKLFFVAWTDGNGENQDRWFWAPSADYALKLFAEGLKLQSRYLNLSDFGPGDEPRIMAVPTEAPAVAGAVDWNFEPLLAKSGTVHTP